MDVAKSQMEKKQTVRGGRSTGDPDMLKEINGIGPSFMVQLKSKLKEILRLRRYVRGYSWLGGRTDLGNGVNLRRAHKLRTAEWWADFTRTLKMACI